MKKYLYILLSAAFVAFFASCEADEGSEPGSTSEPTAVVFAYAADDDSHDPDCDLRVRIASNDKAQKVYLFYEDTLSYQSNIASLGKEGYAKYVVEKGTEVSGAAGGNVAETYVTGLNGYYELSVAAVSGDKMTVRTIRVLGVVWQDLCTGTYYVQYRSRPLSNIMGGYTFDPTFQSNPLDPAKFRYKDLFGKGYHMILTLTGDTDEDSDGVFYCFSMSGTETPFSYGSYGTIYAATYADYTGYTAYYAFTNLYEDYTMYSYNLYYVSAGALCYGYDCFFPD